MCESRVQTLGDARRLITNMLGDARHLITDMLGDARHLADVVILPEAVVLVDAWHTTHFFR